MNINIQVFLILIYIMQYLIIDIIFKEELERIIGIKSIEDLTNGKTDVEAYINNNAITYYHLRYDYYCDRRLRGLLRVLCGHWHYNSKKIKEAQKLKSI